MARKNQNDDLKEIIKAIKALLIAVKDIEEHLKMEFMPEGEYFGVSFEDEE